MKNSNWALVTFLDNIPQEFETEDGRIAISTESYIIGENRLMGASNFTRLKADLGQRVSGGVITEENLQSTLNVIYKQLLNEAAGLEPVAKLSYLTNEFARDGNLTPDDNTNEAIDDLANKVFSAQQAVKEAACQKSNINAQQR